ncbi:hypothetical protein [Actinomadura citrea]|uniref:Uncharacterized protein n=1 Tax=Actinomadura citrea TaxID=46158 RepID=A0A7Y9KGU0_9ACTN|nr:hypothetical protein [Actinomadura citrea]NYE16806.1 hypothetical protein [Actinomadura citrea]GGT58137.1 hypothetical protein GCM10010177_13140 [Actinomadura citrea]
MMPHNPPEFPPVEQWPVLAAPDCPTCQCPADVAWIGPATSATGTEANVWHCRSCRAEIYVPVTHWPVLDGPDCPYCRTVVTCWAALALDIPGDLWTCEHGHEFVLTPEGLIILPEDAA